jgi:hypothetical protein
MKTRCFFCFLFSGFGAFLGLGWDGMGGVGDLFDVDLT